jgi:hypothetical protein
MVQDYAEWNHLAQKIAFGCWGCRTSGGAWALAEAVND